MTYNFLLLNSDETDILLIGQKKTEHRISWITITITTRWMYCYFLYSQKYGVILDKYYISKLSFGNHISHVTKTAFFNLRNIAKLRNMLPVSDTEKLVHAFMTSRLDYCNALLGGCPASSINKVQVIQNAAARVKKI